MCEEGYLSIQNNMDGSFTCLNCSIESSDVILSNIVDVKDHVEKHWDNDEYFDADIQDNIDDLLIEYLTNNKLDTNNIGDNLYKKEAK